MIRKALIFSLIILGVNSGSAHALGTMWEKKYARKYAGCGNSVRQASDGGYVVAGTQWLFGGLHSDVALVKTDNAGNEIWTRTFGVGEVDLGLSVGVTTDGGYVIAGSTWGWGKGSSDVYLVRTDGDGNEVWSRTFGGSSKEQGYCAQQASDGGFIVAGHTASYGTGKDDIYLVKTDTDGNTVWSKTYGGKNGDYAYSVQQTRDGGYIITGKTNSYGSGDDDVYLIKTDDEGNELWHRTYVNKYRQCGSSVIQSVDGGYVLVGSTWHSRSGYSDVHLVRTDASGNVLWSKSYGGKYDDHGYCVDETEDGGYIIAGNTWPFGKIGNSDVYLLRVDSEGNRVWAKTFGGTGFDCGYSVQQTTDGGYIVSGKTNSFGSADADIYLIKASAKGK